MIVPIILPTVTANTSLTELIALTYIYIFGFVSILSMIIMISLEGKINKHWKDTDIIYYPILNGLLVLLFLQMVGWL